MDSRYNSQSPWPVALVLSIFMFCVTAILLAVIL